MKLILVLAVLALTCSAADAKRSRTPVSAEVCEQIRSAVRTYGAALVEAVAVERGYSRSQITYAKARCV